MFYILSNAILMTFIIFGIVVMIKYFPLYFYDIRKNLTQEISRLLHQQPQDFHSLHPLLPPFGYALGHFLLVHFIMGLCDEEGKTIHSDLSHRFSLPSLFPSFLLLFFGWAIFGCHLGDESGES